MIPLLNIENCLNAGRDQVGGKAHCLAVMNGQGIRIPDTVCIPCGVYEAYLSQTRLKDRIFLELHRHPLTHMRWEAIWDIALRIRNLFLTTPIPEALRNDLKDAIGRWCRDMPVAVRSSSPGEDGEAASFAGLHESFINVSRTADILKHVKLVWASLYSDAALLYRKELGLDIHASRMAVIVQALIPSDRSGIFFGRNPSDAGESVVESVYGLNQALVDGDIEPDRWRLDRSTGRIVDHVSPVRDRYAVPAGAGTAFMPLANPARSTPPLSRQEVRQIWETGVRLETLFGSPQDVEWTFHQDRLTILQSRPITGTGASDADDKRSWYLTLHRSYDNLKALYEKIEHRLIPRMISDAEKLGAINLGKLSSEALCKEIENRQKIYEEWVKVYWTDFIPFAHGIRLFGQIYNDAVAPQDPYEFMILLENTGLKSIERNRFIEDLALTIRKDSALKQQLESGRMPERDHPFAVRLNGFIDLFGDLSCTTGSGSECQHGETALIRLLLEFSGRPPRSVGPKRETAAVLKKAFLDSVPGHRREFAGDVLQLGRESFRLRDDDNIHLGRIERRLFEAVQEGQRRLSDPEAPQEDIRLLADLPVLSPEAQPKTDTPEGDEPPDEKWIRSRQIVGHPAGPGIASGPARRIKTPDDLLSFRQGEILVCQGVDPNMTFIVPLAAAVVEERGGMLIHGAIIAREYGLPCITGASQAVRLIETGDQITVDGYLGIITCQTGDL